jgi:hypothetical protein
MWSADPWESARPVRDVREIIFAFLFILWGEVSMCRSPPPPILIIVQVDLVHHFICGTSITTDTDINDHCTELIVFLQLPLVQLYSSRAVAVNLRSTVSRPVCPGIRRPSGTCDQFFFLL